MVRRHFYFALLLISFLPVSGLGQTPVKVSLCDLVKEPQKYTRQWVEVRGTVDIAFENFTLHTRDCGDAELRWIWLAYGGDEPTPTASTVNDRTRPSGAVLKVDNIPVQLRRDANLELFKGRLVAQRVTAPDGSTCYEHVCHFYNVTATLVGLFMAAPDPSTNLSGYGHMGCCHLLTIQQVTDVDAVRTEVPAGGRFFCSEDTWEMDQKQALEAFKRRSCTDLMDCERAVKDQFGAIATHWGDKFEAGNGTAYSFLSGTPFWRSAAMLTTYKLQAHYTDQKHGSGPLLGATATRTTCKAIEPPYPLSTRIRCAALFSDFDVPKKKTKNAGSQMSDETWMGTRETASRQALEKAAQQWGIELLPQLSLQSCDKGEQYTWCHWTEPTSMQSFEIQISRSRFLHGMRGWDNVPWKLSRGNGIACVAEKN